MKSKILSLFILTLVFWGCGSTKNISKNVLTEIKSTCSDFVYQSKQSIKNVIEQTDTSTTITDTEIVITYQVVAGKDSTKTSIPIKEVRKTKTIQKMAVKTKNVLQAEKQDSGSVKKNTKAENIMAQKNKAVKRDGLFNTKNISIAAVLVLLIAAGIIYVKLKK